MNKVIQQYLKEGTPKLLTLNEMEQKMHKAGLSVLGAFISEDFFDIPHLTDDKYSKDGLFYNIPLYDDTTFLIQGGQRTILVLYKIWNRSSECPLRIDFKYDIETGNYKIIVYDQQGERFQKYVFIEHKNGEYLTELKKYTELKLSDLLKIRRDSSENF